MPDLYDVTVVALVASPVHAFEGRPADGALPDPGPVTHESVEIRAGKGIVGDRYFGRAAHADAAVTFFAAESLDTLSLDPPADPAATRRNVILRGFPVDDLAADRGVFSLDCGAGPVRFRVTRAANPCAWMDVALGPGAFAGLRRHGGIRSTPLDDGVLRVGPARLWVPSPSGG